MKKSPIFCGLLGVFSSLLSCQKHAPQQEATGSGTMLADSGFRPGKNGFGFQNEGGQYPKTPPVLTVGGVAKMFGKDACVGGDTAHCKLTPAATEWMGLVNRAMNMGQCEGMAVSSLAFFKKVNDPSDFLKGAVSAHDLTHQNVGPLIGYYWAHQMVNPVLGTKTKSLLTQTPNSVEDTLVEMMKKGELATIAIRSTKGGHAVSPYAVEDRGNGIHWIRIYDNNWPDKERYIIIDRNQNTWKYELASLNPGIPKEPWSGTAESHTIGLVSLGARLAKAECPFCTGSPKKVVVPRGANSVTLTNEDGKKIGLEGDKVVNQIPGADVVDMETYIEGVEPGQPMYVVPAESDYEINISGQDKTAGPKQADDDHGVVVIGNGTAVGVETHRLKPGEADTLSLHHDGGVSYKMGHTHPSGMMPPIRLAADAEGGGTSARITNMKAEHGDVAEFKVDHKAGSITVGGGGKKTDAYDLKLTHERPGAEPYEVEQKGIKFKPGESHTIHIDPHAAKGAPLKVQHEKYVPRPRVGSKEPPKHETRPPPKPGKK